MYAMLGVQISRLFARGGTFFTVRLLWEAVAEWQLQSGSYRVAVTEWQLATAGHHTYIASKGSFAKVRF